MEEVKGYLDGERDYMNLKGGTGPLVYALIISSLNLPFSSYFILLQTH